MLLSIYQHACHQPPLYRPSAFPFLLAIFLWSQRVFSKRGCSQSVPLRSVDACRCQRRALFLDVLGGHLWESRSSFCVPGGQACSRFQMIFWFALPLATRGKWTLTAKLLSDRRGRADCFAAASARNTHRGARTHDHKVKGLALCRLS